MAKEPSNETYLAAELAVLTKRAVYSARMAQELCRLGRRYFRLSEALCNWPDPEEKRAKSRARVLKKVQKLAREVEDGCGLNRACWLDIGGMGLVLIFHTNPEGGPETATALR